MLINDILQGINVKVRNVGWRETLKALVRRLIISIVYFHKFIILKRPLQKPMPNIKLMEQFNIKRLTEVDIDNFNQIAGPMKQRQFLKRFKKGDICLAVFDGENIIYYTWISFNWINLEVANLIEFKKNEAYLFNSYTLPLYRNMGIHTAMCVERLRIVKDMGYERAIVIVSLRNFFAQKALKSAGFEKCGILTSLKVLWIKKRWYRKLPDFEKQFI